jgi:hypothetical protein
MDPARSYPILQPLLSPFRKSQRKTLGLVLVAIVSVGQARSFALAMWIQGQLGLGHLQSAINRFYRLLRNPRIVDADLTAQLLALLARGRDRHLLVAVDWTEWHHGLRMLVGAVVAGRRAIPALCAAFATHTMPRSQNARENTFARLLADAARRARVTVTVICDRGFRRLSWLAHLGTTLQVPFVVRLQDDVLVRLDAGTQVPLSSMLLPIGRVVDLGVVALRADEALSVRVIGYWAPDAEEPWWIATNRDDSPSQIVALYDRRMTVEEQLRDTKGARFGLKLKWTQFRDPSALGRFAMLLGVAILIWTVVGIGAARRDPSLRLCCRRKGPRQSYVTIGQRLVGWGWTAGPLWARTVARLLEPPALRRVVGYAVGGK